MLYCVVSCLCFLWTSWRTGALVVLRWGQYAKLSVRTVSDDKRGEDPETATEVRRECNASGRLCQPRACAKVPPAGHLGITGFSTWECCERLPAVKPRQHREFTDFAGARPPLIVNHALVAELDLVPTHAKRMIPSRVPRTAFCLPV